MAFDYAGARKAGYSDAEIADYLAEKVGFDSAGARKAGYSDTEIVQHIVKRQKDAEPSLLEKGVDMAKRAGRAVVNAAEDAADTATYIVRGPKPFKRDETAPSVTEQNARLGIRPGNAEAAVQGKRAAVVDPRTDARTNGMAQGSIVGTNEPRMHSADNIAERVGINVMKAGKTIDAGLLRVGSAIAGDNAIGNAMRNRAASMEAYANAPIEGETTWQDVKSSDGIMEGLGRGAKFIVEQGPGSVANVGAFGNPVTAGIYGVSLTGNIGQNRAQADGRVDADLMDIARGVPFAAASMGLEKLGIGEVVGPHAGNVVMRVAKAGAGEGLTEFGQGVVEYGGGTVGTKQGFDYKEALDQGLSGAFVGTVMGGAFRVGEEIVDARGHTIRSRPTAPGAIETVETQGVDLTPEDDASPLPNDLIAEGKKGAALGEASGKADGILRQAGYPPTQTRVEVDLGNGQKGTGTIVDAFQTEDSSGVSIRMDDGKVIKDHFADMADAGVRVSPLSPLAESDAIGASLAQQAQDSQQALDETLANLQMPAPSGSGVGTSPAPVSSPAVAGGDAVSGFMRKTRRAESGGSDSAKNPNSSATGRYQFTDGTWLTTYKAEFGDTGEAPAQILAKRGDGATQDRLMERLTRDNAKGLQAAGIPVTEANLYVAHFAGIGGARSILKADPNTPIEQILGEKAIAANPFLKGKTAGDVAQWAASKMGGSAGGEVAAAAPHEREQVDPYAEAMAGYRRWEDQQAAERGKDTGPELLPMPERKGEAVQDDMFGGPSRTESEIAARDSLPNVLKEAEAEGVETDPKQWHTELVVAREARAKDQSPLALSAYVDPQVIPASLVEAAQRNPAIIDALGEKLGKTTPAPSNAPDIRGEQIDGDWQKFRPESGTLEVPRADMPQIKAEDRSALVQFLRARGIENEQETVPAASLKPTQAEFSSAKVEQAKQFESGNRAILVSSDGYVVDGHHQWMAARDQGEDVRTIKLDAPIRELLKVVPEMPSATTADGSTDTKPVEVPEAAYNPRQGKVYPLSREGAYEQLRSMDTAEPVLDLQGNATGWLQVRMANGDGTTLIHTTRNEVRDFKGKGWAQYSGAYAIDNAVDTPPSAPSPTPPAEGAGTPPTRIEDTGTGKSIAVIGASEAEKDAISQAVPKATAIARKDGALVFSKKYEEKIRAALQGVSAKNGDLRTATVRASNGELIQTQVETVRPDEDPVIGSNGDGLEIRQRPNGDRYVMRDGRPSFGGDLAPVDEQGTEDNWQTKFNRNPESYLGAMSDETLARVGKELGLSRGQRSRNGFIEAISSNASADVRAAVERVRSGPQKATSMLTPTEQREANSDVPQANQPEAAGRSAFARGEDRRAPGEFDVSTSVGRVKAEAWYRGWDAANLAAPLPNSSDKPAPKRAKDDQNPHVRTGERYTVTESVDYLAPGQTYTIERGSKRDAYFRNTETGGGTHVQSWQVKRAIAEGKMVRVGQEAEPQESATSADEASAGSNPDQKAGIEDFGEKLIGARKDVWQSYRDRMSAAETMDVSAEPLSKSWPEPDYQKLIDTGADPYVVAWVRAARDEIPTKPGKGWKLKGWAENVRMLRDMAGRLLSGDLDGTAVQKKMLAPEFRNALRDLQGRVDLYLDVGHGKSLKGISLNHHHYSLYRGQKDVTLWAVEQRAKATAFGNWPREIAVAPTREEAIAKFRQMLEGGALEKKREEVVRFDIYSRRGTPGFIIGKKIGKEHVDLKRFDTAKEARDFKISDEGYAELVDALAQFRDIPPERKEANSPRIGINHRNGADVTPEAFGEAFGFRGVQFGNYVEGVRRQADLNEAYDALMDLAGVIGVPAKALSLNGELGLAFGARGTGGKNAAAAHFEPGTIVINLTKNAGAGSLAHEWWHGLDNYFARMTAEKGGFMTAGVRGTEGVRPKMAEAFREINRALARTSMKERARNLDKRRTKDYWSTDHEMSARAFEAYVIAKLQDEQFSNDYLANVVSEKAFALEEGYPYPTAGEIAEVRAGFDQFFETIETDTADGAARLYSIPETAPIVPEAEITGKTLPERRLNAVRWYYRNLVGTTAMTRDGHKVEFTKRGGGKTVSNKGDRLLAAVPAIRQIIEQGEVVSRSAGDRPGINEVLWIAAPVRLPDGSIANVKVMIRSQANGTYQYSITDKDFAPARTGSDGAQSVPARDGSGAMGLNLFDAEESDNSREPKGSEGISPDLQARLEGYGIARKVALSVVDTLNGAAGDYKDLLIRIATDTGQAETFTLDHEAVHALRDMGLFNTSEWAVLAAKAKRDPALMRSIKQRYPSLSAEAQVEEAVADMFARHQRGDYQAEGTVARVFKKLAQAFEAIRNFVQRRGAQTAERVMDRMASGEVGGRSGQAGRDNSARQVRNSEAENFAADWLMQMADVDEMFQNTPSAAATLRGTFSDLMPDVRPIREISPNSDLTGTDYEDAFARNDPDRVTVMEMPSGHKLLVFERGNEVWLDVSRLREGESGSAVYQAVADYAHNTGKVFIGDPEGLSDVALRRRTDAMLSSAIKHGTTDHLAPHPYQREGNAKLGVPPLRWRKGDTLGNVQAMADVSLASLTHDVPDIAGARFDFPSRTFRAADGRVLTDDDLGRAAVAARGSGSTGAGRATLKRGILLGSLARAQGSERPGLLAQVLNEPRQRLLGSSLRDTFYSIPERDDMVALGGSDPTRAGENDLKASIPEPGAKNAIPVPLERDADFLADPASVSSVSTMLSSLGHGKGDSIREASDWWRVRLQDKMLPVLRVQDKVQQALGREIAEAENAYLTEELLTGRAGARLERLHRDIIDPLFHGMKESDVTLDELETYLYARHATERNERIAKINPEFSEGEGSGMTDIQARAIINRVEKSGNADAIKAMASIVDKMLGDALQTRVEAGLLSPEEAAAWRETYQHYVPLRGRAEVEGEAIDPARIRTQSGLSVRGKESKRAFGRRSEADNILAYSILQAEEAIVRAEKNAAAQALLRLAQANPAPKFWQINKIERRPVFDKASGLVRYENQSRLSADDAPYTVTAKVGGDEFHVTMDRTNPEAVRLAEAMRNLDDPKFNKVMAAMSAFNRYFSAINTRFNPAFVITNSIRDVETALVTLGAEDVKGLRRGVLRDYRHALTASDDPGTEWGRWRREWEMAGGKVYYNQAGDLAAIRKDLALRTKMQATPNVLAKTWSRAFDALEAVNEAVERAVRLSVYKNAREAGYSAAKAASLSRNVTTNFTRKGRWGPAINAFYAFFNASTQGSVTFLRAVARSKKARRALMGFVALAFLSELLNALVSGDDDDGESFWDKIPEFEKQKNLIFMVPGGDEGQAIKIPLAYGLNAFANMGRNAAAAMRGSKTIGEAASSSALPLLDAFNPVGSGSLASIIAPTVLDPLADMWANQNFAGKPIHPNQNPFAPDQTPSSTYTGSTSAVAKAVAKAVNRATGGDDVLPGAVSLYPDHLDYVAGFLTGGTGRFVMDLAKNITALSDPEADMTVRDMPIVKSLVTQKAPWVDKERFYARTQEVKALVAHAKDYQDRDDAAGLQRLVDDNLGVARMDGATKEAVKIMGKVRKARNQVLFDREMGRIDDDTAREYLNRIEAAENDVIARYNSVWNATTTPKDGEE